MSKEIFYWRSPEERRLFSAILREGKHTGLTPINFHGCGTFENILAYNGNLYELSVSFGYERLIQIEDIDFSKRHADPENCWKHTLKSFDWRGGRTVAEVAQSYEQHTVPVDDPADVAEALAQQRLRYWENRHPVTGEELW
jgi:hypothetical protein